MDCVVCGATVDPDPDPGDGPVVIEFANTVPAYTEHYGFCPEHAPGPGEVEKYYDRIRAGEWLDAAERN